MMKKTGGQKSRWTVTLTQNCWQCCVALANAPHLVDLPVLSKDFLPQASGQN